jgi:class 3 adenylate cyclase
MDRSGYVSVVIIIAGILVVFGFLQWLIYRYLESKFEAKQKALEDQLNKKNEDLQNEKNKTEELLSNLLPKGTADELIAKGKVTKIKYNFVTVLFSDIQGFTQIAEEMNPEVLIDELDKFFFHFDSVVEKYRIEKIKTIGDAYMCAGGIPEKNRTNPVEVILAALEMQQYMANMKQSSELQGMKYWDIRIGIHTGTVIAGVVGHKKMSYDIWGDTVNTASRMESSGEAGKINISGTTYEFVKDFFVCEHRGRMPVKYKGELDMFFVSGIRPDLCDAGGQPNEKFRIRMQKMKLDDVEETINKLFLDEASPDLYFHNAQMARNINSQVDLLAHAGQIPEEEYIVLKLASIFLITGYITDYNNPAEAAITLMKDVLPGFGFDERNIFSAGEVIVNSFSGTYLSDADRILHDARYDYLGRVDYIRLTDRLLKERNEHGLATDPEEWVDIQTKFLVDHEFLTKTGKLLRSVSIDEQTASLKTWYK